MGSQVYPRVVRLGLRDIAVKDSTVRKTEEVVRAGDDLRDAFLLTLRPSKLTRTHGMQVRAGNSRREEARPRASINRGGGTE